MMYWFILFILLLSFIPVFKIGLIFLIIFMFIHILLTAGQAALGLAFRKKRPRPFYFRPRPQSRPFSAMEKYDDVEDAEFKEEK